MPAVTSDRNTAIEWWFQEVSLPPLHASRISSSFFPPSFPRPSSSTSTVSTSTLPPPPSPTSNQNLLLLLRPRRPCPSIGSSSPSLLLLPLFIPAPLTSASGTLPFLDSTPLSSSSTARRPSRPPHSLPSSSPLMPRPLSPATASLVSSPMLLPLMFPGFIGTFLATMIPCFSLRIW